MTASISGGKLTELLKLAKLWSYLPVADDVDQFDPGDARHCRLETPEPEHWSHQQLDEAAVLPGKIVEILVPRHLDRDRAPEPLQQRWSQEFGAVAKLWRLIDLHDETEALFGGVQCEVGS